MAYVNNKGTDQQMRSLINTIVVRCLDSKYLYLLNPKFQDYLVSVAEHAHLIW